jgi:hypothetical protein
MKLEIGGVYKCMDFSAGTGKSLQPFQQLELFQLLERFKRL